MFAYPVGVVVSHLQYSLREELKAYAEIGLQGIQPVICKYPIDRELTELWKGLSREFGLKIASICSDNGVGFTHPEKNADQIELNLRVLELALEAGEGIITTHIGRIPEDKTDPTYGVMLEACGELARRAEALGGYISIETGPERSSLLRSFLDEIGSKHLGVNFDPANLRMCLNEDPAAAVKNLAPYIFHTHAKDGIYIPAEGDRRASFREVPLGEGQVDFPAYLAALEESGYRGFLTIERECKTDHLGDITRAANYLKKITGQL